jgi:hypothetical protein
MLAAVQSGLKAAIAATGGNELADSFQSPPLEARPWVYWFWMKGNVRKKGIMAAFEAKSRVGVGGTVIMSVRNGIPPGRFHGPQVAQTLRTRSAGSKPLGTANQHEHPSGVGRSTMRTMNKDIL